MIELKLSHKKVCTKDRFSICKIVKISIFVEINRKSLFFVKINRNKDSLTLAVGSGSSQNELDTQNGSPKDAGTFSDSGGETTMLMLEISKFGTLKGSPKDAGTFSDSGGETTKVMLEIQEKELQKLK